MDWLWVALLAVVPLVGLGLALGWSRRRPRRPRVAAPGAPPAKLRKGLLATRRRLADQLQAALGQTSGDAVLAELHRAAGRRVLLVAADTFRAAAIEQLAVWAERSGAELIRQATGADPSAVVFDGLKAARARGVDVVLIDTAGRLHTRTNLMEELRKVRRVVMREDPTAPHE